MRISLSQDDKVIPGLARVDLHFGECLLLSFASPLKKVVYKLGGELFLYQDIAQGGDDLDQSA